MSAYRLSRMAWSFAGANGCGGSPAGTGPCFRLVALAFFAAMTAGVGSAGAQTDPAVIRAALDFYAQSVQTLEGRYHVQYDRRSSRDLPPHTVVLEDLRQDITFRADLVHGRVFQEETESWLHSKVSEQERFEARSVHAYDGEVSGALLYTLSRRPRIPSSVPAGVPHLLNLSKRDVTAVTFVPWHFAGLRLPYFGIHLASLVKVAPMRVLGRETIDGADRDVIAVEHRGVRYKAWLDPQHDFLPRKQEFSKLEGEDDSPLRVLETKRFEQFAAANGDGRALWFPVAGEIRDRSDVAKRVEVDRLVLNARMKPSDFRIDVASLPAGVQINDETVIPNRTSYTGGREDLWKQRDRLIEEETQALNKLMGLPVAVPAEAVPSEASAPPAVAPRPARWWIWLLAAVSVVLIGVGVWQLRRQRRMR